MTYKKPDFFPARRAWKFLIPLCLAGCYFEPAPEPAAYGAPPPGAVAMAPAPVYSDCCYSYGGEYPPYPYYYGGPGYYAGPVVGFGFGDGGGYRHWR